MSTITTTTVEMSTETTTTSETTTEVEITTVKTTTRTVQSYQEGQQLIWFLDEGDPDPFETFTITYVPRTFENEGPSEEENKRVWTEDELVEVEVVKQWLMAKFQSWGEEYDGWDWARQETKTEEEKAEEEAQKEEEERVKKEKKKKKKKRRKRRERFEEDEKSSETETETETDSDEKDEDEEIADQNFIGWENDIKQRARDWRLEGSEGDETDNWFLTDVDVPVVMDGIRLEVNPALRKLDFDNNKITDKGFEMIAAMLETEFACMERLYLSKNKITDFGATCICNALYKNSTLKLLHLQYNNLGDKTCEAFQQYLKQNKALECLDLTGNMRMTNDGFRGFIDAIKANTILVILELSMMKMELNLKKELKYLAGKDLLERELERVNFQNSDDPSQNISDEEWERIFGLKQPTLAFMKIREEEDIKRYRH